MTKSGDSSYRAQEQGPRPSRADEASRAEAQLAFLMGVSEVVATATALDVALRSVARLATAHLADACAVDLLNDRGVLERAAHAHADPAKTSVLAELGRRYPPAASREAAMVVRMATPIVHTEWSAEARAAESTDPEHLALLARLEVRSLMRLPLVVTGRVLGVLTLATTIGREFGPSDVASAQDLARRLALIVEAGRLERDNASLKHELVSAIDDRRGLKRVVHTEQQRQAALVATVPGVVWEATGAPGLEQRTAFVSDYAQVMLGHDPGELVRWPAFWVALTPAEERGRLLVEAAEVWARGAGTLKHRWRTRHGYELWVETRLVVVRDDRGRPIGLRAITLDATDERRAEEVLREAERRSRAAAESATVESRAKDQFLAALSHELRTPLTPVLAAVQMMREEPNLPAQLKPYLDVIQRNMDVEARLIDDLLDLNRIMKGKLMLALETVDLHALIEQILDTRRREFAHKALDVKAELKASRRMVRGDAARLAQVLNSLLQNAAKFTPDGGRITLRTSDLANARVRLEVSDTGVGIDAERLPKVFNAFEQADTAGTPRFAGLGLGLAIARGLVELHEGDIRATSAGRDRGTTLVVELPVAKAVEARPEAKAEAPRRAERLKILLVDDHEDTLTLMQLMLERRDYEVLTARDVASAVSLAQSTPVDLVITDIGLPDESGLVLLERLRRIRPIVGVALSGLGRESDVQRSKDAGFVEHLTKPVNLQRLNDLIQQLFSGGRRA